MQASERRRVGHNTECARPYRFVLASARGSAGGRCIEVRKAIPLLLLAVFLSACAATPAAGAGGPGAPVVDRSYSAAVLADAPAAYWRLGESSGTTMTDASKNGNNGTYAGGVTLAQPGALAADTGTAVAFDGRTGAATVASSRSLQVNRITIELWLKKTFDSGSGIYVAKNYVGSGGVGSGWFELLNNDRYARLEFRVTGETGPVLVSSTTLALNTWYYVVATYDGSVAKLYVNGKLDSTLRVVAVPAQNDDPLYIGRRTDGFFNNVVLQEVAIYPTALSADRIAAHWRAATTNP
jgi:Concanavalin A-like lectin/glucanases superfamily